MLTTNSDERKETPIFSGVLRYFPDALADVARLSKIGNDKHNPGQPLHWSRDKSTDHGDCVVRHQVEVGTIDTDTCLHDTKVAWRALAQLQVAIETMRAAGIVYPPAPAKAEPVANTTVVAEPSTFICAGCHITFPSPDCVTFVGKGPLCAFCLVRRPTGFDVCSGYPPNAKSAIGVSWSGSTIKNRKIQ